ncbi:predicted protein [Nematostella vectensis]|uniref:Coiled-coil SMC6 And NSE5 INteracting (CANIN) domain-containing protein n=1 Tax=Nematostella vectensis TaxID=45351 RepID=A7SVB2_NEMVE|nr:predicted protein [Nematostella vectensis]|eukprot:XP_001624440.1 predicted protein [Nematostella vectensis]
MDARDTGDGAAVEEGNDSNHGDSDDDLLTPPSFLKEKRPNVHVLTPRKATRPADADEIASPEKSIKQEKEVKHRLALSDMLKSQRRHQKKNQELVEMEQYLENKPKEASQSDMEDSELTDDGRDLSQCNLPPELKTYLRQVSDFSEGIRGEEIFPHGPAPLVDTFPCLPPISGEGDQFLRMVKECSSQEEMRELVCGGWLLQFYLKQPCPDLLAEWVFKIMCTHLDPHVTSTCYQVLWSLLVAGTTTKNGIPCGIRGTSWAPGVKHLVQVLLTFGATTETLKADSLPIPIEPSHSISPKCEGIPPLPVPVIAHVVQLLTHGLQKTHLRYTIDNLHQIMVTLCCLSLDLRLQSIMFDIEMCILALLDCFGESQWQEQVQLLVKHLEQLSTHPTNLLHIVHLLPHTPRGIELRRIFSLALIRRFVNQFNEVPYNCDTKEENDVCVTLEKVVALVDALRPDEDSDYHLLYVIIALVDLSLGSDSIPASEGVSHIHMTCTHPPASNHIKWHVLIYQPLTT